MRWCGANHHPIRSKLENPPAGGFSREKNRWAVAERTRGRNWKDEVRSAGHGDPPGGVSPHSGRISPGRYLERAFQSTAMIFEILRIFFENVTRLSFKASYTASLGNYLSSSARHVC
jgi:hypothetical protein